jgi:hypothetical protein
MRSLQHCSADPGPSPNLLEEFNLSVSFFFVEEEVFVSSTVSNDREEWDFIDDSNSLLLSTVYYVRRAMICPHQFYLIRDNSWIHHRRAFIDGISLFAFGLNTFGIQSTSRHVF